jgi:hypothetical protein
MNPLVISRGFGEKVDAVLRNFKPISNGDLLARQRTQLFQTGNLSRRHRPSSIYSLNQ